jgi:hypothetical protein
MKHLIFLLSALISINTFATPGIHEALQNPASVTVLKLCGEKNEAALFTKNTKGFSSLTQVIISGISDSTSAEQDIVAVAACSFVHQLNIENCNLKHLSGAMKMLVSVTDVKISNCKKLSPDAAFSTLAEMPSLKKINFETDKLAQLPPAFFRLRGLEKISISNIDLSLADGYALNTSSLPSLFVRDSLSLGFGSNALILEYGCYDKASTQSHLSIMRDLLQGAVGADGEMTLPQRAVAFNRINPLIHPPIEGVDVRKSIYVTDAAIGDEIEYPSGTIISIPPNAFVDANGNEIKGAVTIDYREFRDQVDILVSGIPMVYDSAGQAGEFQSAGMFEMNASVNGKEVFLAPGKQVNMQFAVVDTASSYNFYKLDDKAGWQYIEPTGKAETVQSPVQSTTVAVNNFSEAVDIFMGKLSLKRRREPDLKDTTSFLDIYADTNYFFTEKRDTRRDYSTRQIYKQAARWRIKKIPSVKGTACFKLNSEFGEASYYRDNPELSAFGGVAWMLNDQLDVATFRQLKSRRSGISDIRINYDGGTDFTMELKLPGGYKTISVTPVKIMDKKPQPLGEKRCVQMNHQYQKSLARRNKNFDRNIKKRISKHERWVINSTTDSLNIWKSVKGKMNADEQNMSYREWVKHVRKKQSQTFAFEWTTQTKAANAQMDKIYQALTIMNFGVYNCDQLQRIEKPIEVNAIAYLPGGEQEQASQMYIIDKNHNQAFSYRGTPGNAIHIAYGADAKNKLIVVNSDGSVSVADEDAFNTKTTDADGNTHFATTRMSDKPVTTQQLREFIYPSVIVQR